MDTPQNPMKTVHPKQEETRMIGSICCINDLKRISSYVAYPKVLAQS